MQAALEFPGQFGINAPLALHPREAGKALRYDGDIEMRLAAASRFNNPRMAGMACAVVDHAQFHGRKSALQLFGNDLASRHEGTSSRGAHRKVKQ